MSIKLQQSALHQYVQSMCCCLVCVVERGTDSAHINIVRAHQFQSTSSVSHLKSLAAVVIILVR
jgi:hypothetical protein